MDAIEALNSAVNDDLRNGVFRYKVNGRDHLILGVETLLAVLRGEIPIKEADKRFCESPLVQWRDAKGFDVTAKPDGTFEIRGAHLDSDNVLDAEFLE